MLKLYEKTTLECSKLITERYSTSFSLGIRMLDKDFHAPIYAIYGFVRFADEIVDTFYDFNQRELFDKFKADTFEAIRDKISLNPVLHSFQWVVNTYQINHELINAFLHSMEMDLKESKYNQASYEEYIYGSAEVVGLMCLQVFCGGDCAQYEHLRVGARRLGAAFQKVNFLRDVKSDFEDRGRIYFPNVDFSNFTPNDKIVIEKDIQADFDAAVIAIKQLPAGAKRGVYLAYLYYIKLFNKIKAIPPVRVQQDRIRVNNFQKILLLLKVYLRGVPA